MPDKQLQLAQILKHPVYIDDVFKNYSELCRHFGFEPKTGKQRDYQKRLFLCYFDFITEPNHNRIIITNTFFDDPRPYEDNRNGIKNTTFNLPMQNLILSHKWDEMQLYTSRDILQNLELVSPQTYEGKAIAQSDYIRKMNGTLDSAVTQLILKHNYKMQDAVVIYRTAGTRDAKDKLAYELSPAELEEYHKILTSVLALHGYSSIFDVYLYKAQKKFWNDVKIHTCKELGIESEIYEGYMIQQFKIIKIDNAKSKRVNLCKLAAKRLCENHAESYKEKDGKKIKAAVGMRPCRILAPAKYNEDMDEVLKSLNIDD